MPLRKPNHPVIGFTMAAVSLVMIGGSVRGSDDPLQPMREQVTELRRELAQAKLELRDTLAELEEMREFLAREEEDIEREIARWRQEARAMAQEREALAERTAKLERAREALAEGPDQPPPPDPDRPRWEIDYRIAAIPLAPQNQLAFIDPIIGPHLLRRFPNIDRRNIMVRGTLQNRSAEPWRYTFEVRVADRYGDILGQWRYQTPPLTPGELHGFEVKVPVRGVGRIHRYQIGNIEADQVAANDE